MADTPQHNQEVLTQAFQRFQEHCERLESVHDDLRQRLATAQRHLEEKNRELARRLEEIERLKERFAGVLEAMSDPVLLVAGAELQVAYANHAAVEFFGQTITGSDLSTFAPPLALLCANHTAVRDTETGLRHGAVDRCVLVSIAPLGGGAAGTDARVVVVKDITDYRRLQERLSQADQLAGLGRVAASVAHEIRNPLAALEGFARLLNSDLKTHYRDGCRINEKVIYAAQQVNAVVRNLLVYAGQPKCDVVPLAILPAVKETVEWLALKAADRRVALTLHPPANPLVQAMADPVQLRQVLGNLLTNAVEACPDRSGGKVDVTLTEQDSSVCVHIADTGCGIAPEDLERIFDPFFTRKSGGIGLGLALCKQLTAANGGRITVDSQAGKGSRFTLHLPKSACVSAS